MFVHAAALENLSPVLSTALGARSRLDEPVPIALPHVPRLSDAECAPLSPAEVMNKVVEFAYTGTIVGVDANASDLLSLWPAAHFLQAAPLLDWVSSRVVPLLSSSEPLAEAAWALALGCSNDAMQRACVAAALVATAAVSIDAGALLLRLRAMAASAAGQPPPWNFPRLCAAVVRDGIACHHGGAIAR